MKLHELTDRRTAEQNKLMWALLTDISNQVDWPVNGSIVKMTPDDWKHVLTAGLVKERRVAAGMDGGFVILGQYTHKMNKAEMSELCELILAFGADKGVVWSEQTERVSP